VTAAAPEPAEVAATNARSSAGCTTIRAKNVPPLPSPALTRPRRVGKVTQPCIAETIARRFEESAEEVR
jgi:hypothetical protein